MSSSQIPSNDPRRSFALKIVRTLRQEGFESLWAGGCVRDQLLGKTPKDYDVASTAKPDDVIRIFGRRNTVAVGASFGVVMVIGPDKASGQVEVATFRTDGDYVDGRRPSSVKFCRPEEDARRRDFTINGMFFDPLEDTLLDYVGGRRDLEQGIVRAIGDPVARFTEDKLRILRAVRFTATFGFVLDSATAAAARQLRHQLNQVSVERVTQELKRMLSQPTRERSFRLLAQVALLPEVLPEICDAGSMDVARLTSVGRMLHHLTSERFEPAFALILTTSLKAAPGKESATAIESVCRRLKLSNEETHCICWLASSLSVLADIRNKPLHVRKPLLAHPHCELLLEMSAAIAAAENRIATDVQFCRGYLASLKCNELCPPPLIDGQDLIVLNVPQGPAFRELLSAIRDEQLDEILTTRTAALERLRELVNARIVE